MKTKLLLTLAASALLLVGCGGGNDSSPSSSQDVSSISETTSASVTTSEQATTTSEQEASSAPVVVSSEEETSQSVEASSEPAPISSEEPVVSSEEQTVSSEEPVISSEEQQTSEESSTPVSEKVYYLVGGLNDWTAADAYKLEKMEFPKVYGDNSYEQYCILNVTFGAESEMKILDSDGVWYPDNKPNLVVHDAGVYDVYFCPEGGVGDPSWYEGYIGLSKHTLTLSGTASLKNPGTGETITQPIVEGSGAYKLAVDLQGLPDGKTVDDCEFAWPKGSAIGYFNADPSLAKNERMFVTQFAGKISERIKVTFGNEVIYVNFDVDVKKNPNLYTPIATVDTFLNQVLTATSGRFVLEKNLDLGGIDIKGATSNITFNGCLDGAGHTIKNFRAVPLENGTTGGLWTHVGSGVIRNLHLIGEVTQSAGWGSLLGKEVQDYALIENCIFEAESKVDTSALDWTWQRSGIIAGFLKGTVRDCVTINLTHNNQLIEVAPYAASGAKIQNVYTTSDEGLSIPFDPNGGSADWSGVADVIDLHPSMDWANVSADDVNLDRSIWTIADHSVPKLSADGEAFVVALPKLVAKNVPASIKVGEEAMIEIDRVNFDDGVYTLVASGADVGTKVEVSEVAGGIKVKALAEGAAEFILSARDTNDDPICSILVQLTILAADATVEVLPVLAQGNNPTKWQGNMIWIYLDNTNLGINPDNASNIAVDWSIVSATSDNPAAAPYVTGGSNELTATSNHQFDDYGPNSVRLMVFMSVGVPDNWGLTIVIDVKITVNGTEYAKTLTFIDCVYQG